MAGSSEDKFTVACPTYKCMWNSRLKHRVVLRCCFSFTRKGGEVFPNGRSEALAAHVAKEFNNAKRVLNVHNIDIEACPSGIAPVEGLNVFVFNEERNVSHDQELRVAVSYLHPQKTHYGHLPVIFCPIAGDAKDRAAQDLVSSSSPKEPRIVYGIVPRLEKWLPFVLMNSEEFFPDGMTLAHEITHAAGVHGHSGPDGKESVDDFNEHPNGRYRPIMSYLVGRERFNKMEVIALSRPYFRK